MAIRRSFRLACVGVAAVSACATTGVGEPPPIPRRTTVDLSFVAVTANNGLRVLLVNDPNASQIQVTMRYRVGAVDDPPGLEGIAHLVEHLMFQQIVGAQSVFAKLQSDASSYNGFTTFDATTYVERASPDKLEEMLALEGVRLGLRCASVTDAAFIREREVRATSLASSPSTTKPCYWPGRCPTIRSVARSCGQSPRSPPHASTTRYMARSSARSSVTIACLCS